MPALALAGIRGFSTGRITTTRITTASWRGGAASGTTAATAVAAAIGTAERIPEPGSSPVYALSGSMSAGLTGVQNRLPVTPDGRFVANTTDEVPAAATCLSGALTAATDALPGALGGDVS